MTDCFTTCCTDYKSILSQADATLMELIHHGETHRHKDGVWHEQKIKCKIPCQIWVIQNHVEFAKRIDPKQTTGYKQRKSVFNIFKTIATFPAPAQKVFHLLSDIVHANKWNSVISNAKILRQIDDNTDINWYSTAPALGGIVAPRDFVSLRHRIKKGTNYLIVSVGHVDAKLMPEKKEFIRGWTGPSGFWIEPVDNNANTRVTWILNSDSRYKMQPIMLTVSTIVDIVEQMHKSLKN